MYFQNIVVSHSEEPQAKAPLNTTWGGGMGQLAQLITAILRGKGSLTYLSMTTAGVWLAMIAIERAARLGSRSW